ncbi:ATP-binding cassette domain-containing protein [Rhodococcus sp. NPDC056960]|uniref:ATP-binding cassette domain-containing protein n=1 Tax=Rhodococcus sp. NPDC056960 TaxID=3345982 RepID=UPI0036441EEB
MHPDDSPPDGPPALEVQADGHRWRASPGHDFTIGRSETADAQLANPRISRSHATLTTTPNGWTLSNHSRNGIFLDGHRVDQVSVHGPTTVVLGNPSHGVTLHLRPLPATPPPETAHTQSPGGPAPRPPTAVHRIEQPRIRIGRTVDNDVILDDLLVSRHHAELRHSGGRWEIVDLDSANGTYVNGTRVPHAPIGSPDVIGVGHQLLRLNGNRLEEYVDTGDVSFEATGLESVTANGRILLTDVGFTLGQRSLLAVVGPTGAGKSTLLNALTGFRPATSGTVRYAGRDLYANYPELRHRIGFVPQDDILHTQLTVRRALNYAARLRFPQDVSAAARQQRIDEVLDELGLTSQADQRITSLSGGQRKRTSVALELLTKPSLLFLDEPTSGLDPGYDKSVMQTLRALADEGRSVVVVTHNVSQLDLCDRLLVLAPGGRLAFFGPPGEALTYFRCEDFPDLFTLLEHDTVTDWAARFRESPLYPAYIGPHQTDSPSAPPPHRSPPEDPAAQQSALTQFAILCRRYLAVIAADRQYTVFLVALPLLLSLFTHAVPGTAGLSLTQAAAQHSNEPGQLLVLLIIGGALMGCAASVREIVKEQAIYRREHAIGLSRNAYLASKLAVLSVITGLQGLVLGILGTVGRPGPDDASLLGSGEAEIAVAVIAVTVTSMIIGLLISALIDNADRGMPLLVLVVMAQLILCGGLFPLHGRVPLEQLSWLSPSRWTYAMAASTVDLAATPGSPGADDPLWRHTPGTWLADLAVCGVLALTMSVVLALLLGRVDSRRRVAR